MLLDLENGSLDVGVIGGNGKGFAEISGCSLDIGPGVSLLYVAL